MSLTSSKAGSINGARVDGGSQARSHPRLSVSGRQNALSQAAIEDSAAISGLTEDSFGRNQERYTWTTPIVMLDEEEAASFPLAVARAVDVSNDGESNDAEHKHDFSRYRTLFFQRMMSALYILIALVLIR